MYTKHIQNLIFVCIHANVCVFVCVWGEKKEREREIGTGEEEMNTFLGNLIIIY